MHAYVRTYVYCRGVLHSDTHMSYVHMYVHMYVRTYVCALLMVVWAVGSMYVLFCHCFIGIPGSVFECTVRTECILY